MYEPDIFNAVRFGSVLENINFYDSTHREVDYHDISITPNTRCSYPLEFMPTAKLPATGGHPKNIIFLCSDANGVLPPVSRLNTVQSMYHFISGYTANMAGVVVGNNNITSTFSACFGEAFLVRHPLVYAEMLEEKLTTHETKVWLLNTGWINGKYGVGSRIPIKHTRRIIDAIHSGELDKVEYHQTEVFKLMVPNGVTGVPTEILDPSNSWNNKDEFKECLAKLAKDFQANFEKYRNEKSERLLVGGPQL